MIEPYLVSVQIHEQQWTRALKATPSSPFLLNLQMLYREGVTGITLSTETPLRAFAAVKRRKKNIKTNIFDRNLNQTTLNHTSGKKYESADIHVWAHCVSFYPVASVSF